MLLLKYSDKYATKNGTSIEKMGTFKTVQDLDFSTSSFIQQIHRKACNVFITKRNLLC